MRDITQLSNEQLLSMRAASAAPTAAPDITQLTDEQLMQMSGQQPAPQPSFGQRVEQDLSQREKELRQIAARTVTGEQLLPRSAVQATGVVVGGGLDVLGEALSEITPESVKTLLRNVGSEIADTEAGQFVSEKLSSGAKELAELEKSNPSLAQDIKSVTNLALFGSGSALTKGTPLKKVGQKITLSGVEQIKKKKGDFIKNLIQPKQTASVRAEQVNRTIEKGFFRRNEVIPTPKESIIAQEVGRIPEVSSKRSMQFNFNAIRDRVNAQSGVLQKSLEGLKTTFNRADLQEQLRKTSNMIAENPFASKTTTDKLMSKFSEIVTRSPNTPAGLLSARKEFDGFVRSIKPKVFDAKTENAFSTAVREIRNTAHNFLDKNVKNVAVKKSLNRQHNLLSGMDNIASKAADEANSSVARLAQRISKAVPLKTEIVGVAALGGLGVAGILNPFTVVPAIGLFGAGRFAVSPAAKRSLGFLIESADKAITATRNSTLKRQLKLDRAAILELLEESDVIEVENREQGAQ